MRIESLITREVINLLRDKNLLTFKPEIPKSRIVPRGALSEHYPLHYKTGDMGKYHPSRKPVGYSMGNGYAFEQARVFGWRSRI